MFFLNNTIHISSYLLFSYTLNLKQITYNMSAQGKAEWEDRRRAKNMNMNIKEINTCVTNEIKPMLDTTESKLVKLQHDQEVIKVKLQELYTNQMSIINSLTNLTNLIMEDHERRKRNLEALNALTDDQYDVVDPTRVGC